jgi:hypothetical protein
MVACRVEYKRRRTNWKPFPDPIKEEEVSIDLGTWTTDKRTSEAIERQARLAERTSADYIRHIIASTLAGDDMDTVLTDDGQIVCGSDVTFDGEGMAQDVF